MSRTAIFDNLLCKRCKRGKALETLLETKCNCGLGSGCAQETCDYECGHQTAHLDALLETTKLPARHGVILTMVMVMLMTMTTMMVTVTTAPLG